MRNEKYLLLFALAGLLMITPRNLSRFSESEFRGWFGDMSPVLLSKLDDFAQYWGGPVIISPHPDALGRHDGPEGLSQHNVDKWGEVRAVDVFPKHPNGNYVDDLAGRQKMLAVAKRAGFTGIGIYTDTQPGNMIHLDVRDDRTVLNRAMWSRVDGNYGEIRSVV